MQWLMAASCRENRVLYRRFKNGDDESLPVSCVGIRCCDAEWYDILAHPDLYSAYQRGNQACGFLLFIMGIVLWSFWIANVFKFNRAFVWVDQVVSPLQAEGDWNLKYERRSARRQATHVLVWGETNHSEEGVVLIREDASLNDIAIIWGIAVVERNDVASSQLWYVVCPVWIDDEPIGDVHKLQFFECVAKTQCTCLKKKAVVYWNFGPIPNVVPFCIRVTQHRQVCILQDGVEGQLERSVCEARVLRKYSASTLKLWSTASESSRLLWSNVS